MTVDRQSVELCDVRNMKTAAVLDAYGFTMKSARAESGGESVRVVFTYIVDPDRQEEFERIRALCRADYDLPLLVSKEQMDDIANGDGEVTLSDVPTLGDYERHFQGIRRTIDKFKDTADDTNDTEEDTDGN